jgi:hypothetical protein
MLLPVFGKLGRKCSLGFHGIDFCHGNIFEPLEKSS